MRKQIVPLIHYKNLFFDKFLAIETNVSEMIRVHSISSVFPSIHPSIQTLTFTH